MKYTFPVKGSYRLTQKFAENILSYSGVKGHTGADYACNAGTPICSPVDGVVAEKKTDKDGYGNHLWIMSPIAPANVDQEIHVLAHLQGFDQGLEVGSRVVAGEVVGYAGTTGYSTGVHLHWGARKLRRLDVGETAKYLRRYFGVDYEIVDYENGYNGHFDVLQGLNDVSTDLPPVATRYGQAESKTREAVWSLTYNEAKVREQALKAGFGESEWPLMKNAFVYGYWPKETVFNTASYALWAYNTKPAFDLAMKTKDYGKLQAPIPAIISK